MSEMSENFLEAQDPFALFDLWMSEAETAEVNDPNAMSLATIDDKGLPDVRMILLKGSDARGFVFYTNEDSTKGVQLNSNPKAAICLHWKSLRRQVRARGIIEPVSSEEADAYFATRSRDSQIGAWSSRQSRPFAGENDLEEAIKQNQERFGEGEVPRPPFWKGYRIRPLEIEFWFDQNFRLHDRILFTRDHIESPWQKQRLFP